MRVRSPAKINLQLRIGPLQQDGFHPLVSWMVTVGLFDTLDFSPADEGVTTLTCSDPSIPTDSRNLVIKAVDLLRAESGATSGVAIHLEKTIPAGGGLGGGSGNAATTLQALNTLWQLKLSPERLRQLAARLGSDVAFFLDAPSALCTGRGEVVSPTPAPRGLFAVLILPDVMMPTPAVYRQLDAMRPDGQAGDWDAPVDFSAWQKLPVDALLAKLQNDLEAPAFALRSDLGQLRHNIEQTLGRTVRMSGSGSTLFTLFDRNEIAEIAAKKIQDGFSVRTINVPLAAQV
ncbi:MAG: 4-(cytidine 5'-diphospho)-2-C-methyl-D-erythritol kinase [Tepidisphaeraceae bacterium]